MHPLFLLLWDSGKFYEDGKYNLEETAFNFIKDNWEEIKKAMGEAGNPEQRHVSYPDPPNRNCHKNCTGYDPCSDICDECRADDEDREDK